MRKTGILLVNLGTPDTATRRDVARYLAEFLLDPRVLSIPAFLRLCLVRGIIVPFRSSKSARRYREIWSSRGSPLRFHSEDLARALGLELGESYVVRLGMRYGKPSLRTALESLKKEGPDKILVLPLFPQYASSTAGSALEAVYRIFLGWDVLPDTEAISHFYREEAYLGAFAARAEAYSLKDYDEIVFSYHGIPESHVRRASRSYGADTCELTNCRDCDQRGKLYCYRSAAFDTSRLLADRLGLREGEYRTSFQSVLGKDPWLSPFTDRVLADCARQGKKRVLVFSPAFVCDCLETLHEIGIEYAEEFYKAGGEKLDLVPSLNDSGIWVRGLAGLIRSRTRE